MYISRYYKCFEIRTNSGMKVVINSYDGTDAYLKTM